MRLFDGGLCRLGVAHVAADGEAAGLGGDILRGIHIEIENRDLGAGGGERLGGGGAEPGASAGDEGGMSFWIHDQAFG